MLTILKSYRKALFSFLPVSVVTISSKLRLGSLGRAGNQAASVPYLFMQRLYHPDNNTVVVLLQWKVVPHTLSVYVQ